MLNDFIVGHKSTFSDFMEIYVEIFSTSTEFLSANLTIFSKSGWQFPTLIRSILDNSEIFFGVNSEYPDNSEIFSGVIRSIRTIPNFFRGQFGVFGQFRIFFPEFRTDFRIICGKHMEIHQNPLFFSRKYFFSNSEKSEYSELYFPS